MKQKRCNVWLLALSLGNRGLSLMHLILISTLSIMSVLVTSQVVTTTVQLAQRASATNELHLIREKIFKRVDCQASLATKMPPLPTDANSISALTQCTTEMSEPFKGPQLIIMDKNGGTVFSKLDSNSEIASEGEWDLRAGCFLKLIAGNQKQYCLLVQRRKTLTNQSNAGYATDWHRLFELPICCDSRN